MLLRAPDRLVQVGFDIWAEPLGPLTSHGPERITLAGRPGYTTASRDGDYQVLLAATTNPEQPGTLRFEITPGPLAAGPLPADAVGKVGPVLTDIVRRHFS